MALFKKWIAVHIKAKSGEVHGESTTMSKTWPNQRWKDIESAQYPARNITHGKVSFFSQFCLFLN